MVCIMYILYNIYIHKARYEVRNMNKYDGNMSMCGYVHINMFIYSSVFVHGFSGLFFTGVR